MLSPVSTSYGQLSDKDGHPRDPRAWEPLWGWSSVSWGTGREEEGLSFTQSRKTKTPWRQWQRRVLDGGPHSKQWEPWEAAFYQQYNPQRTSTAPGAAAQCPTWSSVLRDVCVRSTWCVNL